MSKKTYLTIILLIVVLGATLIIPNLANAATTVSVEKIVANTNGTVDFVIKGLKLENGASYEYTVQKGTTIADDAIWYNVSAPNYDNGQVRVSVNSTNQSQLQILKTTDTAYISIRKQGEKTNILTAQKVDLTLPLLKAYSLNKSVWYMSASTNPAYEIQTVYGISEKTVAYKFEKITDANIVNEYIDNNHDLSGLKLKGNSDFPSLSDTSWKSVEKNGTIWNQSLPTEDGLYYVWLTGGGDGIKTIKGQAIIEVGTVQKIKVETPSTNNQTSNTTTNTVIQENVTNTNTTTNTTQNNKKIPQEAKQFNGHSYYIYENKMTWEEAEKYCESLGGHLVTITTKEEQNFIKELISSAKENSKFWIGANDTETEGTFKWVTGEKFEYTNWGRGEPDDLYGGQDYAIIQNYKIDETAYTIEKYQWDDIKNGNNMFICEWDGLAITTQNTNKVTSTTNNTASKTNNTTKDTTKATGVLPKTGLQTGIIALIVVAIAGTYGYIKYRNLRDVK